MLPREKRWATYVLYGFCRYADNFVDKPRDRFHAEILAEVASFEAELILAYRTGESEHPVINSFIVVAKRYGSPQEYPLLLIKGITMDMNQNRYQSFADLHVYCYRVAAVVGVMEALNYTVNLINNGSNRMIVFFPQENYNRGVYDRWVINGAWNICRKNAGISRYCNWVLNWNF